MFESRETRRSDQGAAITPADHLRAALERIAGFALEHSEQPHYWRERMSDARVVALTAIHNYDAAHREPPAPSTVERWTPENAIKALEALKEKAPFSVLTTDTHIFEKTGCGVMFEAATPEIAFAAVMILNYAIGCEHPFFANEFFDGVKQIPPAQSAMRRDVEELIRQLVHDIDYGPNIRGRWRELFRSFTHSVQAAQREEFREAVDEAERLSRKWGDPNGTVEQQAVWDHSMNRILPRLRAAIRQSASEGKGTDNG
jgi:hypothetical protein